MSNGRSYLSAVGMLWLCVGCTSLVTIDAKGTLKNEGTIPPHVTYAVIPATEVEKDPTFPTYASLVAKQMEERGYKATDQKSARLGVYLAYAATENTVQASGMGPGMAGQGGAGSGTVGGGGGSFGTGGQGGGMGAGGMGPGGGYGPAPTSSAAASSTRVISQAMIVVADLPQSRKTGALVELWRGETSHTAHTNDLPAVIPFLVESAFRHFGETTATTVQHTYGEEEAKRVREGQAAATVPVNAPQ